MRMEKGFNPYSPGFSIYLDNWDTIGYVGRELQSLFTWIFYLFYTHDAYFNNNIIASILIHLDFLSI